MSDLRVVPINDLIEHDTTVDSDCPCGPTDRPIERDDGSIGWISVHHSLDGHEFRGLPQFDEGT